MPFLFPVEVKESTIAGGGRGLFASVDIPVGVTISAF